MKKQQTRKPPTRKLTDKEMSEVYEAFPEFSPAPIEHTLDECRDMKCGCREIATPAQSPQPSHSPLPKVTIHKHKTFHEKMNQYKAEKRAVESRNETELPEETIRRLAEDQDMANSIIRDYDNRVIALQSHAQRLADALKLGLARSLEHFRQDHPDVIAMREALAQYNEGK